MFQNLRSGVRLWILYKNDMKIGVGEVLSTQMNNQFQPYSGTQYMPKSLDIKLKVNNNDVITLKDMPCEACTASFGNDMLISETKDAVIAEVETTKANSEKILSEIDMHKSIVDSCNKLLRDYSPDVKRDMERSKEIEGIKTEMTSLKGDLNDIKAMLSRFIGKQQKNSKEE